MMIDVRPVHLHASIFSRQVGKTHLRPTLVLELLLKQFEKFFWDAHFEAVTFLARGFLTPTGTAFHSINQTG